MEEKYMELALKEAMKAEAIDEVPVGAVIVKDGKIIAKAHNLREKTHMATAHAEILAIEKACKKLGDWRLEGCSMYVTLEPCAMCAGAGILSRIEKIVYGATDKKGGAIHSCMQMYDVKGFNHYPKIESGVMEEECSSILKEYFRKKRINNKQNDNNQ